MVKKFKHLQSEIFEKKSTKIFKLAKKARLMTTAVSYLCLTSSSFVAG